MVQAPSVQIIDRIIGILTNPLIVPQELHVVFQVTVRVEGKHLFRLVVASL
jgi:hypothetical protein